MASVPTEPLWRFGQEREYLHVSLDIHTQICKNTLIDVRINFHEDWKPQEVITDQSYQETRC